MVLTVKRLSKEEKRLLLKMLLKRVNITYQTIAKYFDNRLKKMSLSLELMKM